VYLACVEKVVAQISYPPKAEEINIESKKHKQDKEQK
jgi:hypothetical protein